LIQAESGLISVTGSADEPSRVGISIADISTGMYALTGILGALLRRSRSGEGCNVKIAMLDALGEWMTYPMLRHAYAGSAPPRVPTSHPAIAPYGVHRTKDGQVILGLQNEREWATFCTKVLGRPDVQTDARFATQAVRRQNRQELTALIEDVFADKTSMEIVALLDQAGIANGRLNEPIDVWNHVQFAARDRWREVNTEAGAVRTLLPPVTFTDEEAAMGDVPSIGQHTDQILAEIGFSRERVATMRAAGAV
jgi:crotonobetainyl-CoA:carnitine CoA-transferase CaiB-like acyl-CoA transferase